MSTDLVSSNPRSVFEPIDQWFWPTSTLLSPLMDNNKVQSVNSSTFTTTVSSTSATYHRRHRHWWKVCWIYNNGNFIANPSKPSNFKQFHQQLSSFSMCSANTSAIFNDRCVNRDNKDDQIFSSMAKPNSNANIEPEVRISSDTQHLQHIQYPQYPQLTAPDPHNRHPVQALQPILGSTSNSISSCSPQISSSATSGFLQQKLTQPLTALLKQKSEHKNSISQFFIHFKGSEWRAEQLRYQMPAHDIQMFKLQTNEVKFVRNQQRKAQIKPQLFLNKTSNYCFKCKNQIEIDSYGVKISVLKNGHQNNGYNITTDDEDSHVLKLNGSDSSHPSLSGSTALYHIECFTCEECKEVLVDLKAFLQINNDSNDLSKVNTSLYCNRHFVELYKPRCQFCDHLIFDEECTEAEGKAWHLGHFCCTECKRSLGGQQYIMANPSKQNDKKSIYANKSQTETKNKDKQLPYCLTCFDILFGELCEECGELIGCDVGAISHEGRSWHAIDACFKCNLCSKALLGKPFLPAFDGRIYCSITCSQEAIQRNRYRNRRRQKSATNTTNTTNNDLSKLPETLQNSSQIDEQIAEQMKSTLQMRPNPQNFSQNSIVGPQRHPINRLISDPYVNGLPVNGLPVNRLADNGLPTVGLPVNRITTSDRYQTNNEINDLPKNFNQIIINENSINAEFETSKANDFVVSVENDTNSPNITNYENDLMNRKLYEYLQKYQQMNRSPNYVLDYMKQQFHQNETNGENKIIGATIEYGSSLSEDEPTNQRILEGTTQTTNDINYNQLTSMTSSTSSSLNTTPFDNIDSNPTKPNRLVTHSSSSNETTPLQLRSLEERAQQLTQIDSQLKPLLPLNKRQTFGEQLLPKSESPSQTSQADQSSNSSYIDNNNRINSKVMSDLKRSAEVDSPSTQSTALQSSSQTTPETNPRSANKSVTFDPSVKETTGRRVNRKSGSSKSRSHKKSEWTDSQSCSTCSTCSSSSSSSDDNFDYDTTLQRNRNQWLGGTKIHYVSNDRKKNVTNLVPQTASQSESCSIS